MQLFKEWRYSRKIHNRRCTLKPLGEMTLGGGNRILVGTMGASNSSNKPREKMANSNSTGGDASKDLALSSQDVGDSLLSATTADEDVWIKFCSNACRLAMR
ncbi:Uncharacterised protein [Yersinia rohdei]|uniref:Uncharacterized protein n=1 Tax=Yersinia rohdei TaxID=29485 RepID=A0A0U1HVL2_YERRO|nr:Uncharacterised protein [Yersinia rohdei]